MLQIPHNSWIKTQRFVWQQAAFGQQQNAEKPQESGPQQEPVTPTTLADKNKLAQESLNKIYENSLKRGDTFKAQDKEENAQPTKINTPEIDKQTNTSLGINVGKGVIKEDKQ